MELEDLDETLRHLDDLLQKWGRYSRLSRKREISNTGKICEFMEMYAPQKKEKPDPNKDIRRDLVLGEPTERPKYDLHLTFEQIDRIFCRLDLWVFHMRDREILKKYYVDSRPYWQPWKVAKHLSVKDDEIKARTLNKRLRQAQIYFLRICNA